MELGSEVVVLLLEAGEGVGYGFCFPVSGWARRSVSIINHPARHRQRTEKSSHAQGKKGEAPYVSSPASSRRFCSACSDSRPSRNCSRDRDMWPSCESLWRLRAWALLRSSSDSLMWSASRKRAFGFDMSATKGGGVDGGEEGKGGGSSKVKPANERGERESVCDPAGSNRRCGSVPRCEAEGADQRELRC